MVGWRLPEAGWSQGTSRTSCRAHTIGVGCKALLTSREVIIYGYDTRCVSNTTACFMYYLSYFFFNPIDTLNSNVGYYNSTQHHCIELYAAGNLRASIYLSNQASFILPLFPFLSLSVFCQYINYTSLLLAWTIF